MRKRKFPYPLLALGVILIAGIGFTNMRTVMSTDENGNPIPESAPKEASGAPSADAGKEAKGISATVSKSVPRIPRDYQRPKQKTYDGKAAPPIDQTSGQWWDDENLVNKEVDKPGADPKAEKK